MIRGMFSPELWRWIKRGEKLPMANDLIKSLHQKKKKKKDRFWRTSRLVNTGDLGEMACSKGHRGFASHSTFDLSQVDRQMFLQQYGFIREQ